MQVIDHAPLVEVTRGEIVESVHYGAFCVVDRAGLLLAQAGNPELLTFPRSSLKPFQILSLIEGGGVEHFGFSGEEIAIMCGSHAGTAFHSSVLAGMHQKIGISEADLACGVHWPYDSETRDAMKLAGQTPNALHHNCSGKHTGMLALAQLKGYPLEDYLNPQHPIQVAIREAVSEMVGMLPEQMPIGIDGCSAPVYAIPMMNMAQAVANLADPRGLERTRQKACQMVTSAMMTNPVMVAGPGQFDTDLMTAAGGSAFSKGGAEGYQIIGVMPGVLFKESPGIGIAIKIADGDFRGRARSSVSMAVLDAIGLLEKIDHDRLASHINIPVKNWRKLEVGEVRPAFSLPKLADLRA